MGPFSVHAVILVLETMADHLAKRQRSSTSPAVAIVRRAIEELKGL